MKRDNKDDFITVWRVPANQVIIIPARGSYRVDWGDGCIDTLRGVKRSCEHVYTKAGDYTVSVSNTAKWGSCNDSLTGFKGGYEANSSSEGTGVEAVWHGTFEGQQVNDKLIDISQWGTTKWIDMTEAFKGCHNMTMSATDTPDLSECTSLCCMFRGCTSFNQSIEHWDISNIDNMDGMLSYSGFNQPLEEWDVGNGEGYDISMVCMFQGSKFNQPLGKWNLYLRMKCNNMAAGMFNNSDFNQNHLAHWPIYEEDVFDLFRNTSFDSALNDPNYVVYDVIRERKAERKAAKEAAEAASKNAADKAEWDAIKTAKYKAAKDAREALT